MINHRLATDMLRYEVYEVLRQQEIDASIDDPADSRDQDADVGLNWLPNNGIEGTYRGWSFKILRSRDGAVPPPGKSTRLRSYLCQQLRLLPWTGEKVVQSRPNAVFLWDCDIDYAVFELKLAVPRETHGSYGTVDCYYNIDIPHPTAQICQGQPTDTPEPQMTELEIKWKIPSESTTDSWVEQRNDLRRADKTG